MPVVGFLSSESSGLFAGRVSAFGRPVLRQKFYFRRELRSFYTGKTRSGDLGRVPFRSVYRQKIRELTVVMAGGPGHGY
jgi:hypothetical protein